MSAIDISVWPELPYRAWKDTYATLHLWCQIVGKIRLAQTPWRNHSWHVTLYVSPMGLATSPIPYGDRTFELEFDFVRHVLLVSTDDGSLEKVGLFPPDAVTREAYSHEVSSVGFWPGGSGVDYPAFYSYAYPEPPGFSSAAVRP